MQGGMKVKMNSTIKFIVILGFVVIFVALILVINHLLVQRDAVCSKFNEEAKIYVEECSKYNRKLTCKMQAYYKFCSEEK